MKKRNTLCESKISYTEIGSDDADKDVTFHLWHWNGFTEILLHYKYGNLNKTYTGKDAISKVKQLI